MKSTRFMKSPREFGSSLCQFESSADFGSSFYEFDSSLATSIGRRLSCRFVMSFHRFVTSFHRLDSSTQKG